MTDWKLHVLGSGKGATHVFHGPPSTSFVLCAADEPVLWIDTGLGATRACLQQFNRLPGVMLITHNHTDHAGELPVLLAVEHKHGRRPCVVAETGVLQRLRNHRMAEHHDWLSPDALADWQGVETATPTRIPTTPQLQVEFRLGKHNERSSGFVLSDDSGPVLACTGDSGFDPDLYAFVLQAECTLLDMRPHGNPFHAGFEHFDSTRYANARITGHGLERAQAADYPNLPLAFGGDVIDIRKQDASR